jgi:hypothetical protein
MLDSLSEDLPIADVTAKHVTIKRYSGKLVYPDGRWAAIGDFVNKDARPCSIRMGRDNQARPVPASLEPSVTGTLVTASTLASGTGLTVSPVLRRRGRHRWVDGIRH